MKRNPLTCDAAGPKPPNCHGITAPCSCDDADGTNLYEVGFDKSDGGDLTAFTDWVYIGGTAFQRTVYTTCEREIREQAANAAYDDLRLARDDYEREPLTDPAEGSY